MATLRVLLFMIELFALRGDKDLAFRWELADAIATATDDVQQQETLALIAARESGFRRNVARCEIKGDGGKSLGTFQLQPIDAGHARRACSADLREQARLAKSYVERSAEACPGNVGADRLAMFVSGTCARGLRAARERWATPRETLLLPPM